MYYVFTYILLKSWKKEKLNWKGNPCWVLPALWLPVPPPCCPRSWDFFQQRGEILNVVTPATGFVYESIQHLWVCSYWVEWKRTTQTPLSVLLSPPPPHNDLYFLCCKPKALCDCLATGQSMEQHTKWRRRAWSRVLRQPCLTCLV